MTPLKDILEAVNPASEMTAAQPADRSKSDAGNLRSDAVSLDVPVKVHGSRVTDVVRGITSHTEPFEEQTATMIVFPQGGVLKMSTTVAVGQMLVLTNLKSGHDAICRIVKVRACAPSQSYVEIEFTNRQPGYWGVHFAADGPEPVQRTAPFVAPFVPPISTSVSTAFAAPAQPVAPPAVVNATRKLEAEKSEEKPIPTSAAMPVPTSQVRIAKPVDSIAPPSIPAAGIPVQHSSQLPKPESSFVGIGSQEEVQPPASETARKTTNRAVVTDAPTLSVVEFRENVRAIPDMSSLGSGVPGEVLDSPPTEDESSETGQTATFGRLAASASLGGSSSAAHPAFGSRFDSGALGVPAQASASGKALRPNWALIITGAVALLVVVGGGSRYLHMWSSGGAASSAPVAPAIAANAPQTSSNSLAQANQSNSLVSGKAPVASQASEANSARPNRNPEPVADEPQPSAPAAQRSPKAVPDMFGVLNAHPSASRRANSSIVAPSLDPGVAPGNESGLQGIGGASALVAPVPVSGPNSTVPAPLGGDVKPPRLIHSVAPVYPNVAKSTGVEGKVVIDTSIDKDGNVTVTKILSGPLLLRQAALDALTHWKYQPATLNGNPIPVQFTVTIQFHR